MKAVALKEAALLEVNAMSSVTVGKHGTRGKENTPVSVVSADSAPTHMRTGMPLH